MIVLGNHEVDSHRRFAAFRPQMALVFGPIRPVYRYGPSCIRKMALLQIILNFSCFVLVSSLAALEGYFAAAETDETSSTTYKYKNNKKKYKKKAYSGKMSSSGKMGGSGGKMGGSSGKMGGSSGKMGGSSSGKMDSSAGAASKKMSGGKMSYEYRWYKGKVSDRRWMDCLVGS